MDGIQKALTLLFTVIGVVIFYTVFMTKMEVMAQQAEAKVIKVSADLAWEDYLYQKEAVEIVKKRQLSQENAILK